MKNTILIAALLTSTSVLADEPPKSMFLTATITDIGRPYTVIDGMCAYGTATGFNVFGPEFESAFQAAATRLDGMAKAHGGDAIVGMQVVPISEAAGDRNGVLVCGTFVKYK